MKYCFIINPASGKPETKADLENRIRRTAELRGLDVTVLYTREAGDAINRIKEFGEDNKGEDIRFYACGGDGTLGEAVNGLMRLEDRSKISLGVVPVGTGNDFVRSFERKELFHDIDAQIDAEEMRIDLMRCNGTYAVNMINVGFDSNVVVKTNIYKKKKFIPSKFAYICGLLATLIKKPGVNMSISVDGAEATRKECLLVTFAKGNFCGGGFNSNPEASLVDGKINWFFVNNIGRIQFIGLVGSYKKGTHLCEKNMSILGTAMGESFDVSFDGEAYISIDGELVRDDKVNISCEKGAMKILVPKGCAYTKGAPVATPEKANV